jgi:hypothetical protein
MLSEAQLNELYAPREVSKRSKASKGKQSKGTVIVRTSTGVLEARKITKMGDHDFGAFVGKVGTMRRSTKGATRRMPNGSRKYQLAWYEEETVVAYKLKSR